MAGLSVLRVSERIPPFPGGKEIHIAELTRAQVNRGHDVRVLYRLGNQAMLAAPSARITVAGPLTTMGGLPGTALFAATAARRATRMPRPDVVHVHGDFAEAWWMARYARTVGAAVVLTAHAGLNPRYVWPSRHAFAHADAVIAHGDGVFADVTRCGVPGERITVMSSGLNVELIEAARTHAVREPGLVVAVGSLDRMKNVQTVIRAVAAIDPAIGVRLEVIGDGPLRGELTALRDELAGVHGSATRIDFRGRLDRAEVYQRVAAADAFVIASRRLPGKGEGIPTALLEAMALGRLTLVSTAAVPIPVVTDERSYWTFHPDDDAHLRALIVAAVTEDVARAAIGARARAAVDHLAWPSLAERVDDIYDRALRHHRDRGQRRSRG